MQLIKTLGAASLYRDEMYFGRTTPVIRWIVKTGDQIVAECGTRREAMQWLEMYATPDRRVNGYNVEFLGAQPVRAGEDY